MKIGKGPGQWHYMLGLKYRESYYPNPVRRVTYRTCEVPRRPSRRQLVFRQSYATQRAQAIIASSHWSETRLLFLRAALGTRRPKNITARQDCRIVPIGTARFRGCRQQPLPGLPCDTPGHPTCRGYGETVVPCSDADRFVTLSFKNAVCTTRSVSATQAGLGENRRRTNSLRRAGPFHAII